MASVVSEIKRPFYSMFIPRGGLSDHRTNDDEEKVEAFNAFLPQSLILMINLGVHSLIQRSAGTVVLFLWTMKF